jgi:hypothetical protein
MTFDLPNAGLLPDDTPPKTGCVPNLPDDTNDTKDVSPTQHYPLQSQRSAVGHQPYVNYAPRMNFLQLGEAQAHSDISHLETVPYDRTFGMPNKGQTLDV